MYVLGVQYVYVLYGDLLNFNLTVEIRKEFDVVIKFAEDYVLYKGAL